MQRVFERGLLLLAVMTTSSYAEAQGALVVDFEPLPVATASCPSGAFNQGALFSGGFVVDGGYLGLNETHVFRSTQPIFNFSCAQNPMGISFDEPMSEIAFEIYTPNDFVKIQDDTGWSQTISVRNQSTGFSQGTYRTTVTVPSTGVSDISIEDLCNYYAATGCTSQWRFALDNVTFRPYRPCLTIVGPTEIEPNRSGSHMDYVSVVVTVDDCEGNPLADVVVKIAPEVEKFSGGHQHDDGRPNGRLRPNGASGAGVETITDVTNSSGEVTIEFVAPQAAGTYMITAECPPPQLGCTPPAQPHKIEVKVPNLEPIPYSFWYALSENGHPVGYTQWHPDNHYLAPEASVVLEDLSVQYVIYFATYFGNEPDLIRVNDASLAWGGVFDLAQNWVGNGATGHAEHRRGSVVDIRANGLTGTIPYLFHEEFKAIASDLGANAKLHGEDFPPNQHFHVRLLGSSER